VDAVLLSHPDVIDAVAFPIPHDMYGEEVAASVVLKSLENSEAVKENIIEHMKKTLAPFKIPKRFFLYDQPLPRSATGFIS
jgi:acyl-coenzyme A synthetase/AMP-(fatty) acid ligase